MPLQAFQVHFENPVQDSGAALTNVVFLSEEPSADDVLAAVLSLYAGSEIRIQLKPASDKKASPQNHHLRLTFDPDTLTAPGAITLAENHTALWDLLHVQESRAGEGAGTAYALGQDHLYLLYKGTTDLWVGKDSPLRLMLRKVGAAVKGGTRGALAELTLTDRVSLVELSRLPEEEYNLTERTSLSLIARRTEGGGKSVATLAAGFVTSDVVLNDGSTKSYLVLQIANTGPLPIALSTDPASPSTLSLVFTAGDATTSLSALGTIAQVRGMHIPGRADGLGTDPSWSGKDDWTIAPQANGKTWVLTPKAGKKELAPDEAIEIPISNVVTGHVTGRAPLRVRYTGLPAHQDGELTVYIQKYPLIYADTRAAAGPAPRNLRVGIGTKSPADKLTVETEANESGIAHTDGTVTLATRLTGVGTGARTAGVGTRSNHPLFLYTNNGVTSPAMTLTTDGRIGVHTAAPSEPLTVHADGHGITHTDGTVKFSTYVAGAHTALRNQTEHPIRLQIGGATHMTLRPGGNVGVGADEPTERLHVEGNLRLNGKLGVGIASPAFPVEVRSAQGDFGFVHSFANTPSDIVQLGTYVNADGGWFGTRSNHKLYLYTGNSAAKVTLTTDGKLGIGTLTPQGKLDVSGDLRVNGVKPIVCRTFNLGNYNKYPTGYSDAEWIAMVVGFDCSFAVPHDKKNAGMWCYPYLENGMWWIICAAQNYTHVDSWVVNMMFVRRELVEGTFAYRP